MLIWQIGRSRKRCHDWYPQLYQISFFLVLFYALSISTDSYGFRMNPHCHWWLSYIIVLIFCLSISNQLALPFLTELLFFFGWTNLIVFVVFDELTELFSLVFPFISQVREAQLAQYNYILVVGEEELNTKQVSRLACLMLLNRFVYIWWTF